MQLNKQKTKKTKSITTILAFSLFALSLTSLIISGGLQLYFNIQAQRNAISGNQQLIAQNAARDVSDFIMAIQKGLKTSIWMADPTTLPESKQSDFLQSQLGLQPSLKELLLFDLKDQISGGVSRRSFLSIEKQQSKFKDEAIKNAHLDKAYISDIYIDEVTSEPLVLMGVPIFNVFKEYRGLLLAELNLKFMWDLVDQIKIGKTGYAYVVDRKGNLISFGDASRVLKGENIKDVISVADFIKNYQSRISTQVKTYSGITGTTVVGTYVPLNTPDWAVITELPWTEAYRNTIQEIIIGTVTLLLMAVLIGFIGSYLARRISIPIVDLMSTASQIADGERNLLAEVKGPKEVSALAGTFNSMTTQLRKSYEKLEQQIVELRQAEEAIAKSERRFRAMIEHSADIIALIDQKGTVIYESPNVLPVSGYDVKTRLGKSGFETIYPDDMEKVNNVFNKIKSKPNLSETCDFRVLKKDGTIWWAEATATNKLQEPDINAIIINYREITERKRTEEELQKKNRELDRYFTSSLDLLCIADFDGRFRRLNPEWEKTLGYSISELEGKSFMDYVHPDDREATLNEISQLGKRTAALNFENRYRCKEGSYRWIEWRSFQEENLIYAVARDITERKQTERLLLIRMELMEFAEEHSLQELLQKTLDEVDLLTDSSIGFYHFVEADQKRLSLQAWSTRTIAEFCSAEGKGMHYNIDEAGVWVDCVHTKQPVIHNDYHSLKHRKGLPEGHAPVIRELVVPIIRENKIMAILGVGNKPSNYTQKDVELVTYLADLAWEITNRKRMDEALKESEAYNKILFRDSNIPLIVMDPITFKYTDCNEAAVRIYGFNDRSETLGKTPIDVSFPIQYGGELSENIIAEKIDLALEKGSILFEWKHQNPDGKIWDAEVNLMTFKHLTKKLLQFSLHDITEQRQAQIALRESEERFRAMIEHSSDAITLVNSEGKVIYESPTAYKLSGYSNEERIGNSTFDTVYPEDFKKIKESFSRLITNPGGVESILFRGVRKDGTIWWVEGTGTNQLDEPSINAIIVNYRNVTDRKVAEENLKMFKYTTDCATDAIFWMNKEGGFVYVNDKACISLGYTREELLRIFLWDIDPIYPKKQWFENWESYQKNQQGGGERIETVHRRKDGSIFSVEVTSNHLWFGEAELHVAHIRDITEKKRAEETLKKNQAKLTSIFKVAPTGIGMVINRILTEVNDRVCEMVGRTKEELTGKSARVLYPSELDFEYVGKEKYRQIKEYGIGTVETRWIHKDGHIIDVLLSSAPINPYDFEQGITFTALDITERKKAEETLRESEEKFSKIFYSSPVPLSISRVSDGKYIEVNDSFLKRMEIQREDVIGKSSVELDIWTNPTDRNSMIKDMHEDKILKNFEGKFRTKSGEVITSLLFRDIVEIANEKYYISTSLDITDRKKAEDELRITKILLEQTIEQSPVPMVLVSMPDTVIRIVNRACLHFLGIEDEPSVINTPLMNFKPSYQDFDLEGRLCEVEDLPLARSLIGFKTDGEERYVVRKDGTIRYDLVNSTPIYDEKGQVIAGYLIMMDITDRKKAEEEIRKLNEELETRVQQRTEQLELANKELESFAYSISHDLRAPLRAIDGFSSALQEDYQNLFDEQAKNYISRIRTNSQKMSTLIDDLLNMSRVVRKEIDKKEINLSDIAEETYNELTEFIGTRKIEFRLTKQMIDFADPVLIKLCLQNMIDNAIKFSVSKRKTIIQFGYLIKDKKKVYYIKDNGVGFNNKYAGKLFGVFQRLHSQEEYPGTGVGLATVQKIIFKHGGKIWAESKLNKGATFYFTLNEKQN
jgi:PAS domain S-box-containing protein